MKYVEVGGERLSAIGLGTWQFGSTEWGYGKDYASGEAGAIVKRALELGVNLIDTAEVYGIGRSERIVGEAIRGRREKVFLATKLFPIGLPFQVEGRARASAKRLGVDRLDLYQLHWPSPLFPPGWTMPRMKRLLDSGLVSHIGVSNHSLAQWQGAERALGGPVLSNQVRFSLIARAPELELLPWAQREGRLIIAYSPLGQGLLSGKYQKSPPRNFRRPGARSATRHASACNRWLTRWARSVRSTGPPALRWPLPGSFASPTWWPFLAPPTCASSRRTSRLRTSSSPTMTTRA
jgi:Predicted oxidoreductases (related to aryl-alcohol dehydrogenases)